MKKINEKHIDAWLDKYPVDLSEARLSQLEDRIFQSISFSEPELFLPMGYKECIGTISIVGLLATALLLVSNVQSATSETSALLASATMYGGF